MFDITKMYILGFSVLDVIIQRSKEPVTPAMTHFSHATDLQQIYYAHNVIVGR